MISFLFRQLGAVPSRADLGVSAMDSESEVDFSSNSLTPLWRRRSTPQPQLLGRSKPRPQSYQSPTGLLITDFPVEDRGTLPAMQATTQVPTASEGRTVQENPQLLCAHRRVVTNGRTVSPEYRSVSPRLRRPNSPQAPKAVSGVSSKSPANGTGTSPLPQPVRPQRTTKSPPLLQLGGRPDRIDDEPPAFKPLQMGFSLKSTPQALVRDLARQLRTLSQNPRNSLLRPRKVLRNTNSPSKGCPPRRTSFQRILQWF